MCILFLQTKESKSVIAKVSEFMHTKINAAREKFDSKNIVSLIDLYLAQEGEENCVTGNLVTAAKSLYIIVNKHLVNVSSSYVLKHTHVCHCKDFLVYSKLIIIMIAFIAFLQRLQSLLFRIYLLE